MGRSKEWTGRRTICAAIVFGAESATTAKYVFIFCILVVCCGLYTNKMNQKYLFCWKAIPIQIHDMMTFFLRVCIFHFGILSSMHGVHVSFFCCFKVVFVSKIVN